MPSYLPSLSACPMGSVGGVSSITFCWKKKPGRANYSYKCRITRGPWPGARSIQASCLQVSTPEEQGMKQG